MAKTRKRYYSASQVATFLQCPLAFKYIYVDEPIRGPSNVYIAYGDAFHKTLDFNYGQKITSFKDLPYEDLIQFFRKTYDDLTDGMPDPSFQPGAKMLLRLDGEKMLERYMQEMAPYIQPLCVEQEFELHLQSIDIWVKGYIDLITVDGYIVDHKTCSMSTHPKRNQNAVDINYQLTMYSLAYRKIYGKPEAGTQIHKLVRGNKNKDLFFEIVETKRNDLDVLVLVQLLFRMSQIIENDLRYPNLNSCETCDFRESCNRLSIQMP